MKKEGETENLFQFTWGVLDHGYHWRDDARTFSGTEKSSPPYLIVRPGSAIRQTFTLEDVPLLFQRFAETEPVAPGILEFANRWGALGIGESVIVDGRGVRGESLSRWKTELGEMALLYKLWTCIQAKNPRPLTEHIHWKGRGVEFVFHAPHARGRGLIADEESTLWHLYRKWRPGDVFGPAKVVLLQRLNKKLRSLVAPCALLDRDGTIRPSVSPFNTLGAIWLTFYRAVTGERRFVPCRICRELMDVTDYKVTKRTHDRCSRNLKQHRWRRKAKRARRKSQKGS